MIIAHLREQKFAVWPGQAVADLLPQHPDLKALGLFYDAKDTQNLLARLDDREEQEESVLKKQLADLERVRDLRDKYREKVEEGAVRKGKEKSYEDLLGELEHEHPEIDLEVIRMIADIEDHPVMVEQKREGLQKKEHAYLAAAYHAATRDDVRAQLEAYAAPVGDLAVSSSSVARLEAVISQFRERPKKEPRQEEQTLYEPAPKKRDLRWLKRAGIIAGIGLATYGLAQLDWSGARVEFSSSRHASSESSQEEHAYETLEQAEFFSVEQEQEVARWTDRIGELMVDVQADGSRQEVIDVMRSVLGECDRAQELCDEVRAPYRDLLRETNALRGSAQAAAVLGAYNQAYLAEGGLRDLVAETRRLVMREVTSKFSDSFRTTATQAPEYVPFDQNDLSMRYDARQDVLEVSRGSRMEWDIRRPGLRNAQVDGVVDFVLRINDGTSEIERYLDVNARTGEVFELTHTHTLDVHIDQDIAGLFDMILVGYGSKVRAYHGPVRVDIIHQPQHLSLDIVLQEQTARMSGHAGIVWD